MTRLVGSAIGRATTALLDADLALAESVIAADEQVDALQRRPRGALPRAARPAGTRSPPTCGSSSPALRMSADLERMGDLARHVAKLARMRYPESAVPPSCARPSWRWARSPSASWRRPAASSPAATSTSRGELETDDDVMDPLHRELFTVLLDDDWEHGIETAVDVTLCGRYYERFADHAVSVARRVAFLVTGERGPAGRENGLGEYAGR